MKRKQCIETTQLLQFYIKKKKKKLYTNSLEPWQDKNVKRKFEIVGGTIASKLDGATIADKNYYIWQENCQRDGCHIFLSHITKSINQSINLSAIRRRFDFHLWPSRSYDLPWLPREGHNIQSALLCQYDGKLQKNYVQLLWKKNFRFSFSKYLSIWPPTLVFLKWHQK